MPDPRLIEAMEACRPGSDDVSDLGLKPLAEQLAIDPALQHQYRRLQRLDQSLADAFLDVPVPEGLADRILGRLAAARGEVMASRISPASLPSDVAPPSYPTRVSRRWVLAGGLSVAGAASILALIAVQTVSNQPFDGRDLPQRAIELQAAEAIGAGQLITDVSPPAGYPMSDEVRQQSPIHWRWVADLAGRKAVAYDLSHPNGTTATLYVIRGVATGLPDAPEPQPFVTQGVCASAWYVDGLAYVLVVYGGQSAYSQFILAPRGPLT